MPILVSYYGAASVALATHAGLQLREINPVPAVFFTILLNGILHRYLSIASHDQSTIGLQLKLNLTYLTTLLLSIGIYRRYFHRLRHFPGPAAASVSKFWAFAAVNKGTYFSEVQDLHKQLGDIVRVGPRELDICNLSAVNAILGGTSPCTKGAWYDGTHMGDPSSTHVQLDKLPEVHAWKRRIWDVALSSKALRDYEPRVLRYVDELIRALRGEAERTGGVVDIGLWISFFTFDVMGDLAFGESFDMLASGKTHDYMRLVQGYAHANALICTIPWVASIFPYMPKLEAVEALYRFAREKVVARLPLGEKPTDVFSYLLREDRVSKGKFTQKQLNVECVALIIGGSDTTSSTLANTCYYLISNPATYQKLKDEIDPYDGPLDHANLAKFPYLNAVIRETLRMMPPIRSGMMHRVTPPEGITVPDTGVWIPGNVNVGIGSYELQHDARYWANPDEYTPERWLDEGPEPREKMAYLPFSFGPYSCVGKHLAYMELCNVIAAFVRYFDMSFDPKYDPTTYISSIKDSVISTRAYLPVVLKSRSA